MKQMELDFGVRRVTQLENMLGGILDEWDREELKPTDQSSDVYREDLEADLGDLFERARTLLATDEFDYDDVITD